MSAAVIEDREGLMLGSAGTQWIWCEPDDPRVHVFDSVQEARDSIPLLPHRVKKGHSPVALQLTPTAGVDGAAKR